MECFPFWVCLMFAHDCPEFVRSRREEHGSEAVPFSVHHMRWNLVPTCVFGVILTWVFCKVLSAMFLHCAIAIFPSIINKCLEEDHLRLFIYSVSHTTLPMDFGTPWWLWPATIMTAVFISGDSSIPLISSIGIHWTSSIRKLFLLSHLLTYSIT